VDVKERTTARRLLTRDHAVHGVETDRGELTAPIVVNCLGSWATMEGRWPFPVPIEPARGQILAFRGPRNLFRRTIISERAYAVQRRDGRLITGSTIELAGFEKTLTLEGIHGIVCGLRHFSSAINACPLVETWAGFRPCAKDRWPILGKTALHGLYMATGHFRHGILLAPATAKFMAELILHSRASFDLSPFSIERFQ
ncbi:MAG: FAD-dependent oxidoreductase, partial [Candidatus Omnitrophica bacterium]|nr:FAD-dependent oxidoreductase [Candidatus Omnitrophota bacterium]